MPTNWSRLISIDLCDRHCTTHECIYIYHMQQLISIAAGRNGLSYIDNIPAAFDLAITCIIDEDDVIYHARDKLLEASARQEYMMRTCVARMFVNC